MNAPAAVQASPLYLVDASLYVFRAWHSMPNEFHDRDGWPTNAVHGFARFLLELLERERPSHIAIAFDEALDSCFRNALYPAYKANRDPAPVGIIVKGRHQQAQRGVGVGNRSGDVVEDGREERTQVFLQRIGA